MKGLRDLAKLSAVRQTAWLLGLFSMISLIGWGSTFLLVRYEMLSSVDARLVQRMERAQAALRETGTLPAPNPGETATLRPAGARDGFETADVGPENTETRFLRRTTPTGQITLSEDIELQEELRDILAAGMQASLIATLICTALAGAWMARRAQRRLDLLTAGLARVAEGQLDTPIALPGHDDLALLAQRIDRTTAKLSAAMVQIRVQSSNIAHDLRTPLARLRAHLERNLIQAHEQDQPISADVLEEALNHIDRIAGTFEALLRLSSIESGAGKSAFQTVDLTDLIEELAATYLPVIEDAGQKFQVEITAPGVVQGDKSMLSQMVANLIQNALRYGAAGQTITLRAAAGHLTLTDEGPGIPQDEREKVVLPLYQGTRTRQNDGFGLGLSLVRAITDLHGADFTLLDGPNGKGLTASIVFPVGTGTAPI